MSVSCATLSAELRKARYGVAYVRSICSQAGVPLSETDPDEDVLAVDCDLKFPEASVRVQVKCTSRWKITGKSISWPVAKAWVQKWDMNELPVYFIVVIVPSSLDR